MRLRRSRHGDEPTSQWRPLRVINVAVRQRASSAGKSAAQSLYPVIDGARLVALLLDRQLAELLSGSNGSRKVVIERRAPVLKIDNDGVNGFLVLQMIRRAGGTMISHGFEPELDTMATALTTLLEFTPDTPSLHCCATIRK